MKYKQEQAPSRARYASSKLLCLVWMLGGAVLTALTLVFPQIGLLQWISMIPMIAGVYLFCEREDITLRSSYGFGFLTVFSYYFILYHWFVNLYPLDFVGMDEASSLVVVLAGWLGLSLLQAIPGGLIFLLYRLITKSGAFSNLPLLRPFAFAALWTVFEWSSTFGWTGVPWGRLALGQIELLPMVQISSAFGSYAVSFLLLAVNGLLAYAILYASRRLLCTCLAAGLVLGNLCYGWISLQLEPQVRKTVTAAVIQGNINSHDKWSADSTVKTKRVYAEMTRAAAAEGAELVIWPETTLPYVLNRNESLTDFVSELARECEVTLIVGALYREEDAEYNSLYLITSDGQISDTVYSKRHLVPFGEYVPMREVIMTLIPPLSELSALGEDLAAGKDSALFETEFGMLGSLICFDSIYEALGLDSVRDGAELMVISSNDSWFYDSAAVYQHQAQAQLRAVEEGRFYLRAANTGISSVIDANGRPLARIDPLVEGYAVCEVELRSSRTLYSVLGNLLVYLCIALVVLAPMAGKLPKRGKK